MKLTERPYAEKDRHALVSSGIHPLLARLYAARRITSAGELRYEPGGLHPPGLLKNLEHGAALLADASPPKSACSSLPTTTPTARLRARSACARCSPSVPRSSIWFPIASSSATD